MAVLLENITPPENGWLDIDIKIKANIRISGAVARRQVSLFVTHHIADLLRGEAPHLVWGEQGASWRVPVALSSPSKGRIGTVGTIDVDVETGRLNISDALVETLEAEAQRLAENAAL